MGKRLEGKLLLLGMLVSCMGPSVAQVSVGIGFPNVSIGINVPVYPDLVPVPGYPVYYAPGLNSNYFFYDGMYWVYQSNNWYASSWYDGPWGLVGPEEVPVFILRVPVSYYRQPPGFFAGWQLDASPRWGEHWGGEWEHRRAGWDRWDHNSAPAPAPLPAYQRQYSGDRYPRAEQQHALQSQNDRYRPRDPDVRKQYEAQQGRQVPAPAEHGTQPRPQANDSAQRGMQRSPAPVPQAAAATSRAPAPQGAGENAPRSAVTSAAPQVNGPAVQSPQHAALSRQQPPIGPRSPAAGAGPQGKTISPEAMRGQELRPHPPQVAVAPQQAPAAVRSPTEAPPRSAAPQESRRPQESGQDKGREKADERGPERR